MIDKKQHQLLSRLRIIQAAINEIQIADTVLNPGPQVFKKNWTIWTGPDLTISDRDSMLRKY